MRHDPCHHLAEWFSSNSVISEGLLRHQCAGQRWECFSADAQVFMCLGLVWCFNLRRCVGVGGWFAWCVFFLLDQVGGQICPCSAISCLNHVRRLISDIQTHWCTILYDLWYLRFLDFHQCHTKMYDRSIDRQIGTIPGVVTTGTRRCALRARPRNCETARWDAPWLCLISPVFCHEI